MPKLANEKAMVAVASFTPKAVMKERTNDEPIVTHVVQPKETAYSICKKYNVSVDDLKSWNNLATTDLKIGQEIKINKPR